MDVPLDHPAEEIKRLQRCINDLVSALALPAIWIGGEPSQIARTLLDALFGMLRLDLVYVCLNDPIGTPTEMVRLARSRGPTGEAREIGERLRRCLGPDPQKWPAQARHPIEDEEISIVPMRLGLQGDIGVVVAGSRRADFPGQAERLVLSVAVNQAAVGLQEARLRTEQKRVADDLDERVAQRTSELAAANEALRNEVAERRRVEEALRESERHSRSVIDSIPGMVATLSPAGEVEFVNDQILAYCGRSLEELKQWETGDTVHPEDLPRVIQSFTEAIASGHPYEIVQRIRRHDGVYRWFHNSGLPLRDSNGRIIRYCSLLTDVDARKRAEEALWASERNLKLIIDTVPALAWSTLPDGSADFFNQHYLDYVGLSSEQLRDWGWTAVIHPDDMNGLANAWETFRMSGRAGEGEARLRRHDGEYRWFLFRTDPLHDENGNIVKWYGINTDIEDRKQAEEKLRRSELHARLIVDSVPGFVVLMTPAGELEYANHPMLEYFGGTLQELREWEGRGFLHPDDLPQAIEALAKSINTGRPYEMQHRCRRFDGVYRWFQARGLPLRDTAGRIARWYFLLTDVEDRKWAETQLAGEKQLLEMIASGRSLRDILNALCRFVELATADSYCGVYPIDWSGRTFQLGAAPSLPASYTDPIEGWPVRCDLAPCGLAVLEKTQVIVSDIGADPRWEASAYRTHVLTHGLRSVWSTPIYSLKGHVLGTFCIYQCKPASPSPRQQDLIARVTHIASIAIERSQAEAALKRSEAFLAEGQRLSQTGTFSWQLDTDQITFSEQLYRILELEQGASVTLAQVVSRVHPEDVTLLSEKIAFVRGGGEHLQYEIRLLMADGRAKYVRTFGHVIRHHDGRRECVGAVQDVTQRRLSDEALDKARSELAHVTRVMSLGTMTASIAHEVNQPLSGIVTNASTCLRMLAADPPNVDGARETARRTIRDGNRAADVITRLRALFGRKDSVSEPVDLNEATREVIALLGSELQRNRVILRAELSDDLSAVTGDRVQLQQVILNLLRNGSDAMSGVDDRPRQLVIRTEQDACDDVRLTVRDVGGGIDPQAMERLFDAFYTTKSSGMGIGLSVSRSIIERHRGRLWAASNDGPGATFAFSIPRRPEDTTGIHGLDAIPASVTTGAQHVMGDP
jgi:PAS domain S-box-containing protein